MNRFSERHGLAPDDEEIRIREDAPHEFRGVLVNLAYEAGHGRHSLRTLVCGVLRIREDAGNWSAFPNVDQEVRDALDSCAWYEVYDVAEAIYESLTLGVVRGREAQPERFERELNQYFRRRGIGWQLSDGRIEIRGDDEFEAVVAPARHELEDSGRTTAANEIREALRDLSARPKPDRTGAIQLDGDGILGREPSKRLPRRHT